MTEETYKYKWKTKNHSGHYDGSREELQKILTKKIIYFEKVKEGVE